MNKSSENPLDTFLSDALKTYKNNITEDYLKLTELAKNFLNSNVRWDEKNITKIHISLESHDQNMTLPGSYPAKKIKENGHYAVRFLKSYFRCLLEVYIQCLKSSKSEDRKIVSLIRDELGILNTLIFTILDREKSVKDKNAPNHISFMKQILEDIKGDKVIMPVQYQIGYPGHTYYIVYTKKKGMLRGTIFNLGEGCHLHRTKQEDGICKVRPYILEITDIESHLNNLVYWRELFSFNPETELDDATIEHINHSIYTSGKYYGSLNFHENEQETGNCVAKNYFFAMRARMPDRDFNRIIKKSITVLLAYKIMFNEGMDEIETKKSHENLKKNLDSFKQVDDDTQSVYGSLLHLTNPSGKSKDGISPTFLLEQEVKTQRDQIAKTIAVVTGIGTALSVGEAKEEEDMPTWLKLAKAGIAGGVVSVASYYAASNLMDYFNFPSKPKLGDNQRVVLLTTRISSAPSSLPKPSMTGNVYHSFNQSGTQTKKVSPKNKSLPRSKSLTNMDFS